MPWWWPKSQPRVSCRSHYPHSRECRLTVDMIVVVIIIIISVGAVVHLYPQSLSPMPNSSMMTFCLTPRWSATRPIKPSPMSLISL